MKKILRMLAWMLFAIPMLLIFSVSILSKQV